jgi:CDP-glucose 4,6-dehydratase
VAVNAPPTPGTAAGIDPGFWRGRRVLVTGHTGFKGSWLTLWLSTLGADVAGFALEPDTSPSLFLQLGLTDAIDHRIGDVRDARAIADRVAEVRPEVVIHMAAQPLVRRSYAEPVLTWQTNVMGTVHLLEALRPIDRPCAVVIVTTDKVYENREWVHAYRETDRLGGHDPYSSSKAACELATDTWRNSFFAGRSPVRIASARAGNVIGGGDWAEDRIVPDLVRALAAGRPVTVRNPASVRPWQHVLDPLSGYLTLARNLFESDDPALQSAFNFGPDAADSRTVRDLVDEAFATWPGTAAYGDELSAVHEARLLTLATSKARAILGWSPTWGFRRAVADTIDWYRAMHDGASPNSLSVAQVETFEAHAVGRHAPRA